jgi:glucose-1-phosphate thymidylyltransferase
MGYITKEQLLELAAPLEKSGYGTYLKNLPVYL